jgi:hypothetical protein
MTVVDAKRGHSVQFASSGSRLSDQSFETFDVNTYAPPPVGPPTFWSTPVSANSPSDALYVADFRNERHVRAWRTLERLQLRTDAVDEQRNATRAFDGAVSVPPWTPKSVWRSTQALPNQTLPHVARVLKTWRKNTPSSAEVLETLSVVWSNAEDDHRPAVESFAKVILMALRRGAWRHVVGASLTIQPRLLALVTGVRLSIRGCFSVRTQLHFPLIPRGPPGLPAYLRRGAQAEVIVTA